MSLCVLIHIGLAKHKSYGKKHSDSEKNIVFGTKLSLRWNNKIL